MGTKNLFSCSGGCMLSWMLEGIVLCLTWLVDWIHADWHRATSCTLWYSWTCTFPFVGLLWWCTMCTPKLYFQSRSLNRMMNCSPKCRSKIRLYTCGSFRLPQVKHLKGWLSINLNKSVWKYNISSIQTENACNYGHGPRLHCLDTKPESHYIIC